MSEIKNLDEILLPKYLGEKKEIIGCNTKRLTAPGENYGSLMLALDIRIKNKKDEQVDTLHVVAKAVPQNEFIQRMFKSSLTFRKELEFYRTIVPTLIDFQRDHGIEHVMDFFPDFYGGRLGLGPDSNTFDNDAVILMENLKLQGYICIDRTKGFDLDAAKYILTNLATFHAVPLALKLKEPEIFKKKILPFINNVKAFDGIGDDIATTVINGIMKIAEENKKCVPFSNDMKNALIKSINCFKNPSGPRESFATLIHCDFWVNNTMIKIEEDKATGIKIVDFQLTEYGSPARDLIFFIFDSIQNNVVVNHFDHLIQYYHQCFIDTLCMFNIDTKPFSLDNFKKEIDLTVKESVLFQCCVMLKPIFAQEESIKEIENMSESDLIDDSPISQNYKEKLWMIVTEFANRHWL